MGTPLPRCSPIGGTGEYKGDARLGTSKRKMVSYRELPVKTLPKCLLLDLRRKNIRVPPEIQMTIMWYKEVTEAREKKDLAVQKIKNLPMCRQFLMPQTTGEKEWKSSHKRVNALRKIANPSRCHWCTKFYREMLPMGVRAEMSRPNPNLDRLFNEGGWMAMELYRHRTIRESTGTQLCHTNRRSAEVNTVEDIMKWIVVNCSVVDLVTEMDVMINMYE